MSEELYTEQEVEEKQKEAVEHVAKDVLKASRAVLEDEFDFNDLEVIYFQLALGVKLQEYVEEAEKDD